MTDKTKATIKIDDRTVSLQKDSKRPVKTSEDIRKKFVDLVVGP